MLKTHLQTILAANPEYAAITPVIEKEIVHHDIMDVLVQQGVMQSLVFIGGTSLRLCYQSSRLSEDLDFNAGHNFKPTDFDGLEIQIQNYLEKKYETDVSVHKPTDTKRSNTSSWKISIEKTPNRPDLPRQKMHIDICAIPSFDVEKRPLINHYNIVVPTEGLLIPVQSLNETLADKWIALAYRSRRIKPRDLWDILWLHQKGTAIHLELIEKKLAARTKSKTDFFEKIHEQVEKVQNESEVQKDFINEMQRFIPQALQTRTLDNPDYWHYLQSEILKMKESICTDQSPQKFNMDLST